MTLLEKELLDDALELYYNQAFIEHDPISMPIAMSIQEILKSLVFFRRFLPGAIVRPSSIRASMS